MVQSPTVGVKTDQVVAIIVVTSINKNDQTKKKRFDVCQHHVITAKSASVYGTGNSTNNNRASCRARRST